MSESTEHYLAIGDFSRFAMLSVRMLRHYDERGLLCPAFVDPFTGYRYYLPHQLREAGQIRALRDAGCGIAQIGKLLPLFSEPDRLGHQLAKHAKTLEDAVRAIEAQQLLLEHITHNLKETNMSITVNLRTMPPMLLAELRGTIPTYSDESLLWKGLWDVIMGPDAPCCTSSSRRFGSTYYDEDYCESDVDISVWAEVSEPFEPVGGVECIQMPEQKVAWATLYGPYEGTSAVAEAIGKYVAESGLRPAGPMYNIYIVSPEQDPNPEHWVTEINYPVS